MMTNNMDLILADVFSSPENTLSVLAELKNRYPHLPVVFLTHASNLVWLQTLINPGLAGFLIKSPATLLGLPDILGRIIVHKAGYLPGQGHENLPVLHSGSPSDIRDVLPCAYLSLDPQGQILHTNHAWSVLTGYPETEVSGQWLGSFLDKPSGTRLTELLACLNQSGLVEFDAAVITKSDTQRAVSVSCQPEFSITGSVARIHCLVEESQPEVTLDMLMQEKGSIWELITENISDIVWISDLNLKTIFVSRSVQRILGESIDQHLARSLEQKHPPEALAKMYVLFREEMELEKDQNCDKSRSRVIDVQHYHAGGHLIWVSIHVTFIRNRQGKAIAIEGITRDITELKNAEEALQRSEALMRGIFDLAPAAIGVVHNRVMTEVNPMMCSMLGYTKSELLGQSSRMVYPSQEEFDYVGREKYEQIEQTGKGIVETKWLTKDGRELNILLASVPIDQKDSSRGVLFVALDNTARKEAEMIIRQQLEELRRWHETTLGRESRILELKAEVNNLLKELGKPGRYSSVQ